MAEDKTKNTDSRSTSSGQANDNKLSDEEFKKLLEDHHVKHPNAGDLVKGKVISASKSEVKIDIDGVMTGVVRGPELYEEDEDYADLKAGDKVEATVVEPENENGDLELSFRYAGQEKAWTGLREAYSEKGTIKVKVVDANKGGLLVKYRQIAGFLPVSQLAPENYPRVSGGDKGKILEKLRSFSGQDFEVKVMTLQEKEDKIIFSEKEAWNERQKDVINKYKVGTAVEGKITAITDFGVFISFGENLEGLIHISELAWQRIENPGDLFKVGDMVKAEVISLENSKIFLSAKKLIDDPWKDVEKKYKPKQIVQGKILKVNPFGLFVSLDQDIHGLAHVSQLELSPQEKIMEKFKAGDKVNFEIVSIEPKEHRLGLAYSNEIAKKTAENVDKKEAKKSASVKASAGKKDSKDEKTKAKKDPSTRSARSGQEKKAEKTAKKDESTKKVKAKKEPAKKAPSASSPQSDSGQAGQVVKKTTAKTKTETKKKKVEKKK